jgi:hypothetical protein
VNIVLVLRPKVFKQTVDDHFAFSIQNILHLLLILREFGLICFFVAFTIRIVGPTNVLFFFLHTLWLDVDFKQGNQQQRDRVVFNVA